MIPFFRWSWWKRMIPLSLVAAMAVPFVDGGLSSLHSWSFTLTDYGIGVIYSLCLGVVLTMAAMPLWPATCKMPVVFRWLTRSVVIAAVTGVGCLLAGIPTWVLIGPRYQYWRSFEESYGVAVVLSIFATCFSAAYERFRSQLEASQLQLKEKEVEREKALKLATEATLSSLESRMHPHFLFNTINSIASLIHEDPARAEKMLSQMADLLRFSLDSGRTGLVPLSRELKIVRDYLEIEKARFEERLRYEIEIPAGFEDLPFPPLSLQTLVENSLKYAVGVTRNGADIRIRAQAEGDEAVISVADNGPGFSSQDLPAGHGLSSLMSRLESLYGNAARLRIESEPGSTRVAIHVPMAAMV